MSKLLGKIIDLIPHIKNHHAPNDPLHLFLKKLAQTETEKAFGPKTVEAQTFGPFGELFFPHHVMGNVSSTNLFDLDELILFSFYWKNRNLYNKVLDIGANIGLHSIILSRCGYDVSSYEPDPIHVSILKRNLSLNFCNKVAVSDKAVSKKSGTAEFIRLIDNTTGSHLAGAKPNPYGSIDRFTVKLECAQDVISHMDLVKIDAEGHEKEILFGLSTDIWGNCDFLVEIGSKENAKLIFNYFKNFHINLFAQKINWSPVLSISQMPHSYRDGTLFISTKDEMPW